MKHTYSIYRKMFAQNKTLDEIFDLYAFRVIVDDIPECYNVLGCIHDMFKPVLGRFKDYIGTPKPNMLPVPAHHRHRPGGHPLRGADPHLGHAPDRGVRRGRPLEVQAGAWPTRSWAPSTTSSGCASCWRASRTPTPDEFVRTLKVDMFADEVFVFTPNGDVINLPAGATPIDFAYYIHSAVGNRMMGAKVNGRMVPFDHQLSQRRHRGGASPPRRPRGPAGTG